MVTQQTRPREIVRRMHFGVCISRNLLNLRTGMHAAMIWVHGPVQKTQCLRQQHRQQNTGTHHAHHRPFTRSEAAVQCQTLMAQW